MPSLRDHYLRTTYRVTEVTPPIDIRIGEPCAALDALLEKHASGKAGGGPSPARCIVPGVRRLERAQARPSNSRLTRSAFIAHPSQARSWAFITAWNPASKKLDDAENRRRQHQLEAEVKQGGYVFYRGAGVPDDFNERSSGSSFHVHPSSFASSVPDEKDWQPEESLLILGIERSAAEELGRKFGQAAVVVGEPGSPPELLFI